MEKAKVSTNATLDESTQYELPITLYGTAIVKRNCFIGAYTYINANTTIYPSTKIGRYCSIAKNCEIAAFDHPIDWLSTSPFQYNMKLHYPMHTDHCHQIKLHRPEKTTIKNDVWIGANSVIKRGITLENGVIVAAGAVVIKDVPPYAIVGGVPAKIIKYRFDKKTIQKLLALKWWELTPKQLDGVPFDTIHKAIKEIERIRKPIIKKKTKKCWVCNRFSESKLITTNELEKYLKKGWIKGKSFKTNENDKKIVKKNSKKSIEKVSMPQNTKKDKRPDTKEIIIELQKSVNKRMKRSKDTEAQMSIETLQIIISSQLLEADIPQNVIDDIFKHNKNMYRDYDEDEHADQVILNHKITTLLEIITNDELYLVDKKISAKTHKKISNILKSKQ